MSEVVSILCADMQRCRLLTGEFELITTPPFLPVKKHHKACAAYTPKVVIHEHTRKGRDSKRSQHTPRFMFFFQKFHPTTNGRVALYQHENELSKEYVCTMKFCRCLREK